MYFEETQELWQQYRAESPQPATPAEIQALESQLGLSLPAAYREFLSWLGNGPGIGGDILPLLAKNQTVARQLVENQPNSHQLPDNVFVFYIAENPQPYYFLYFLITEDSDPPVHSYELKYNKFYVNLSSHFSSYISEKIASWLEKNFEPQFIYLAALETRYEQSGLAQLVGCSKAELDNLERELDIGLPQVYREFLVWMGHDAKTIFPTGIYQANELLNIAEAAQVLLQEHSFPGKLDDENLVFWLLPDEAEFFFIRLDEGDDPPVYVYQSSITTGDFIQTWPHFSTFLAERIEAEGAKLAKAAQAGTA